ncbi:membrane protein insertase YidC [Pelagibius marinus]|uniref:membrane protein insertase YidC n=1 Tax=Pelagibius marinus TaxID=2762760 RepID=UPI0018727B35|nr:membrane protein insertase YidC [Pelagibius marinus]
MEQRNLILAIVLSMAILFGFQFLFPPATPPEQTPGQQQAQTAPDGTSVPGSAPSVPGAPSVGGVPTQPAREDVIGISPRVSIQTPLLSGSIALRGARLDDLILTQYHETLDDNSAPITLLSPEGSEKAYYSNFGWAPVSGSAVKLPTAETLWTAAGGPLTPSSPVTLTWDNGEGLTFEQVITIDDNYLFTVTQRVVNNGAAAAEMAPYGLISRAGTPPTLGFYILHEGPVGVFNGSLDDGIKYDDLKDEYQGSRDSVIAKDTTGGWLGITDKYWLTALVPEQQTAVKTRFVYNLRGGRDHYQSDFLYPTAKVEPGASVETTSRLFAGAKVVPLLQQYEETYGIINFDLAVDFGWFKILTKPIFYALHWLHAQVGNFGIAILLLTVAIKLVFFPLANKSYKSMAKMRKLQPKMMELRERFAEDKQRLNQEMMALYKKEGANPLSGCLPILIQIPVFFALYKVMFVTIEMRHAPFYGWIHDLSAPDPTTILNGFGLFPWDAPELGILHVLNIGVWPLLMGISMFLQQKLNPQPPDPVQAKVFLMMPVIFTFLLSTFPAGLVIYWTWNNVLSMAQQAFIMKRQGVPIGGGSKKKPNEQNE